MDSVADAWKCSVISTHNFNYFEMKISQLGEQLQLALFDFLASLITENGRCFEFVRTLRTFEHALETRLDTVAFLVDEALSISANKVDEVMKQQVNSVNDLRQVHGAFNDF